MLKINKIIPVILSGGIGSRLWPLSRDSYPKQFLILNKGDSKSLFQQTQERLKGIDNLDNPIIICNEEHRFLASEQMRLINIKPKSILLEPFCRNTAPAITIAALKAIETEEDPLLLILPADHKINDVEKFQKVIGIGENFALNGRLTAFGIVPNYPETGYGYIEAMEDFTSSTLKGYTISKFFEKPSKERAKKFLKNKKYSWNSGMYIFKANIFLDEIKKLDPELFKNCKDSISKKNLDLDFQRLSPDPFKKCSNISIDTAVMERTKLGTVIPLDAGWSDIGSWKSLWNYEKKDINGNVKYGKVFTSKTENSYIRSNDRLLVTHGIKDLIIIETSDIILVANLHCSQEIKLLINRLHEDGLLKGDLNRRIYRPWGNFLTIAEGNEWKVKSIEVKPGASLSLQMHKYRAEHWVVVDGIAKVEIENKIFNLKNNESIFVPKGSKHRLSNPSKSLLIIIEVQSGNYLGEDDILRFKDNYGRS